MTNGIDVTLQEGMLSGRDSAQERVENAVEELATELAGGKSYTLQRYLQFMARFHRYSFGNCILIACQRGDATLVAGYRRWQELERQVKRGERGIAIFAPMTRKFVALESTAMEESEMRRLIGFRMVRVFDVSQTDGKPVPEFSRTTGDATKLVPAIERVITSADIRLAYEPLRWGANGCTDGSTITVRPDLTSAEQFRVLVHELAHNQLEHLSRRKDTTKQVRETEAEAVAYVVARAFGIDARERSRDYIHLWDGDRETLVQSMSAVQRTAGGIIRKLDTELGLVEPYHDLAA